MNYPDPTSPNCQIEELPKTDNHARQKYRWIAKHSKRLSVNRIDRKMSAHLSILKISENITIEKRCDIGRHVSATALFHFQSRSLTISISRASQNAAQGYRFPFS